MKKMILSAFCFCLFSFVLTFSGIAQSLSSADIKEQMVKDWQRGKSYTIDYLNTMPADKYSFKAVDSLRSFAQQMLHLAAANVFLMMNATGQPPLSWLSFDLEGRTTAQKKDSVMYFITTSYDYCINAVKNYDVTKWGEKTKLFERYEQSRFALMNKVFEHQTHHRGQTTIYIRLQGIVPPQERLFE
jgi:uncharacterized damage-inducible protein DinB